MTNVATNFYSSFSEIGDGYDVEADDFEVIEIEDGQGDDDRYHLVFLVPGIRSDGVWAQEVVLETQTWDANPVEVRPVIPNQRISSFHLATRLFLTDLRRQISAQITEVSQKFPDHVISVVAHSMGSSLFAEVIEEISNTLEAQGRELYKVIFVGSVCRRKYSRKISSMCDEFVNDVGVRDYWAFVASILRPGNYNDVGFAGFNDAYTRDRFSKIITRHAHQRVIC